MTAPTNWQADLDERIAEACGETHKMTEGQQRDQDIAVLVSQLRELTKRWTAYEDIPRSQQYECRDIGRKLHALGAEGAMRDAYYEVTGRNRAATVVAAYFDG